MERRRILIVAAVLLVGAAPRASAERLWSWRYVADGIAAAGTFVTDDAPDAAGFYRITGIAGQRNGIAITGLQAIGTAIPGNEGFPVDNRVSAAAPHLTKSGVGIALRDGTFANPFFAEFRMPPAYLEFHARAAVPNGHTELPVIFTVVPAPQR